MASYENQKFHPFGIAEQRFKWAKIYSNGNDLKNHKKIILRNKDNLDGGIGSFLTRNEIENEKGKVSQTNLFKNRISKNKAPNYLKFNSQRVIHPEKDTEVKKINKKRTYESQEKNLIYSSNGSITSLLNKTPLHFKNRGKKIFNNFVEYGRKKDTNLFSEEFLNDKTYNRIPGVTRKHLIHKVNIESQPLDEYFNCNYYKIKY